MKKISFIALLLLTLSFSACKNDDPYDNNETIDDVNGDDDMNNDDMDDDMNTYPADTNSMNRQNGNMSDTTM